MSEDGQDEALSVAQPDADQQNARDSDSGTSSRSWDQPLLILALLFGVTLFLGLPVLWASRRFSKPRKWLITVAVLVHTVVVFWLFWLVMAWCYERISAALSAPI